MPLPSASSVTEHGISAAAAAASTSSGGDALGGGVSAGAGRSSVRKNLPARKEDGGWGGQQGHNLFSTWLSTGHPSFTETVSRRSGPLKPIGFQEGTMERETGSGTLLAPKTKGVRCGEGANNNYQADVSLAKPS